MYCCTHSRVASVTALSLFLPPPLSLSSDLTPWHWSVWFHLGFKQISEGDSWGEFRHIIGRIYKPIKKHIFKSSVVQPLWTMCDGWDKQGHLTLMVRLTTVKECNVSDRSCLNWQCFVLDLFLDRATVETCILCDSSVLNLKNQILAFHISPWRIAIS